MGRSHASLSTKIHLACDALGYPLGFILTGANVSDFDQARPLLKRHLCPNVHVTAGFIRPTALSVLASIAGDFSCA